MDWYQDNEMFDSQTSSQQNEEVYKTTLLRVCSHRLPAVTTGDFLAFGYFFMENDPLNTMSAFSYVSAAYTMVR